MDYLWELLMSAGRFDNFCCLIGLLFLLDLISYLPFFYVGFAKTEERRFQPDRSLYLAGLGFVWLVACGALMFGSPNLRWLGTLCLYVIFRHYYVDRRWNSIRRGFGAPGNMSHWTVFYLLLMQTASALDASGWLTSRVVLMSRVDFAVIMLCAGTYKYLIGYMHSEGWEYGRVNPMWSYFWRTFRSGKTSGPYIVFTNIMAAGIEVLAGFLMLTPGFSVAGSLMISASFLYVGTNIRLGRLAILMTVLPFIFYPSFLPSLVAQAPTHVPCPDFVLHVLSGLVTVFMVLLPLVKISQYSNLFANKSLPEPLQSFITRYANLVPITIWRVFTADVTNFFIRIYEVDGSGRESVILNEETYSLSGWSRLKLRFLSVTESIAITSVFTTLKYFPSNRPLFDGKLLTYARSLEHDLGRPLGKLRFEYVALIKGGHEFIYRPVGNFHVDLSADRVTEEKLVASFDFAAAAKYSPVREAVAPGSYVAKT